jgi:hypothetical protein
MPLHQSSSENVGNRLYIKRLWAFLGGGNYVEITFDDEDGRATGGTFLSADGKQYWLER